MSWPDDVRKSDLTITKYRGSGPGGQHRNKTDSAVRIKHNPTGITASSEEHKSQTRNLYAAFKRLGLQLAPLMLAAASKAGPEVSAEEQNRVIRTYNEKRRSVKDYRTDRVYHYDDVLAGKGLDDIWLDLKGSV